MDTGLTSARLLPSLREIRPSRSILEKAGNLLVFTVGTSKMRNLPIFCPDLGRHPSILRHFAVISRGKFTESPLPQ